ncbi:MAG: hypothetical protein ABIA75_05120 [Candidatus Neomarinimicrobiota bacterium]
MFKAIAYKEWLKIRWFVIGTGILSLLWMGNIFLNVNHSMKFTEAINYWYNVIFRGLEFYSSYLFIPMIIGLVLAAAQFVPETTDKRIKLTFHLPLGENNVLLQMLAVGLISLVSIFVISFILLAVLTGIYFPGEVVISMMLTTLPWFLAGLVIYLAAAAVILEPNWWQRFFITAVSIGFLNLLTTNHWYNIYQRSILFFFMIGLCFCLSLLLSGHRFRKGVA